MAEINLLKKYPKSPKPIDGRLSKKDCVKIQLVKQFGKEYFDGSRKTGYGGYYYDPKYWSGVVKDIINYYHLTITSSVLDVGCAKGFMLYEFCRLLPGISIRGIDISEYALANAKEEVKPFLIRGSASDLSMFKDNEMDLIISINTLHNLNIIDCKKALKEIQRVGKHAYLMVASWRNEEEKQRINKWTLTTETSLDTNSWKHLFNEVGFSGDYFWFIS
ncbi:MAG: class I SAM-dependent methyltransferase [Nanoarchaeota archaeon]|nr:class I SAM-dependent methyltransferase [Nanoarchaeota archaeon]